MLTDGGWLVYPPVAGKAFEEGREGRWDVKGDQYREVFGAMTVARARRGLLFTHKTHNKAQVFTSSFVRTGVRT